ncbi:YfhD family protein [Lentibacillus saliphilus]|uniref:YfhD family protein n=1 Tax=Lentibacillus saliphilus TaxID=2737028 RepID=UPI001C30D915|nr:YfhD family protein [Lentibacillus saliphilus]
MGRDEHKHAKGKNVLAQTPRQMLSNGIDVEFSAEFADEADEKAKARRDAADQRNKTRN